MTTSLRPDTFKNFAAEELGTDPFTEIYGGTHGAAQSSSDGHAALESVRNGIGVQTRTSTLCSTDLEVRRGVMIQPQKGRSKAAPAKNTEPVSIQNQVSVPDGATAFCHHTLPL